MRATIQVNKESFFYSWSLVVELPIKGNKEVFLSKTFYLGQDVKFCNRVLGMEAGYVVSQIGGNDVENPKTNKKLAKFIIKSLGLTESKLHKLNVWELCCQ